MNWEAPQEWLADTRLFRCLAGTMFRSFARRRVAALDHQVPDRCQDHSLVRLVHRAHTTRFGRDHDFRRIRNAADFRRLVPLRGPDDLWRDYWQNAFPDLSGTTWPGPLSWLAAVEPVPGGPRFVPLSGELRRSHRVAALTALALIQVVRPRSRPLAGRSLLLAEAPPPAPLTPQVQAGGFGGTLLRTLPPLLRPFLLGPGGDLAALAARRDITCVMGDTVRLLALFARLLAATGRDRLVDLWPNLTAVLTTRTAGPTRERLAAVLGCLPGNAPVPILEVCFRPEASLAIEDPRCGQLRLLADHGVYYEFVPREDVGRPKPARHSINEVEPGVPYAVAVTSPAGLWACTVGFTVCFLRRGLPLLEWARSSPADAMPLEFGVPEHATVSAPFPVPAPHVRPAALRRAATG